MDNIYIINDGSNNNYNNNYNYSHKQIPESGAATALRITFAIIAFFTIGLFINTVALGITIFSGDFWHDAITNDEVKEALKDEANINVRDLLKVDSIDLTIAGEEMTDEFIDIVLDEMLDLYLNNDAKVDKDRVYQLFDDYEGVIFRGYNPPESVIERAKEETYEMFQDKIKEAKRDLKNSDTYEALCIYDDLKAGNTTCMIICGIATLVMVIVLILIHKNKFRPMRAFGISMTVAQSCNLILWFLIYILFSAAKAHAKGEEKIVQLFASKIHGSVGGITLFMFILLLVGITLIVGGSIGIKKANSVQDDWE